MKFLGKVFICLVLVFCGICLVKFGLFDKLIGFIRGLMNR